jgi:hypothetical protein
MEADGKHSKKGAGPVWRPANPDDRPSQKLIEAKLAHDRQQMEHALDHLQIHDPTQRQQLREAMMAKRSYDARRIEDACRKDEPPTNALECGLLQGWAQLKAAGSDPFSRKHDVHKPFRDMLLAVEAFKAGSLELLIALRGEAPNKTNAAQPSDAIVRALLTFCVGKLSIGGTRKGGFPVTTAANHVADYATTQGLPRTRLTVRGIYYDVLARRDERAADLYYSGLEQLLSHGEGVAAYLSRDARLAWLRQVTIFAMLAES